MGCYSLARLPIISSFHIHGAEVNAVNARDLHAFMENRDHFTTWIQDRIKQYGFVEHRDFETFSESSEKGRPSQTYMITLDMAKLRLLRVLSNDRTILGASGLRKSEISGVCC